MKARFDAILLILLFCLCTASAEPSHAAGAETASARAKLEETPAEPRHLITVHGVGYKFVP